MSWFELLQSVFTSVQMAVYRLNDLDPGALREVRALEVALDRLRGATAKKRDEDAINKLWRDAHTRSLALAQLVKHTPARTAVGRLVDLLTTHVKEPQLAA